MKTILEDPTPRIDKTLEWLNQSRDQWKEKCLLAKTQLKRQKLATKRLRDGRHSLKEELKTVQRQIEKLEVKLEEQDKQLLEFKKKF